MFLFEGFRRVFWCFCETGFCSILWCFCEEAFGRYPVFFSGGESTTGAGTFATPSERAGAVPERGRRIAEGELVKP